MLKVKAQTEAIVSRPRPKVWPRVHFCLEDLTYLCDSMWKQSIICYRTLPTTSKIAWVRNDPFRRSRYKENPGVLVLIAPWQIEAEQKSESCLVLELYLLLTYKTNCFDGIMNVWPISKIWKQNVWVSALTGQNYLVPIRPLSAQRQSGIFFPKSKSQISLFSSCRGFMHCNVNELPPFADFKLVCWSTAVINNFVCRPNLKFYCSSASNVVICLV